MTTAVPPKVAVLAMNQAIAFGHRPIFLDYFQDSINGKVSIGRRGGDKATQFLMKNADEYTSCIQKIFQVVGDDGKPYFLLLTENSLYITAGGLKAKNVPETFGQNDDSDSSSESDVESAAATKRHGGAAHSHS